MDKEKTEVECTTVRITMQDVFQEMEGLIDLSFKVSENSEAMRRSVMKPMPEEASLTDKCSEPTNLPEHLLSKMNLIRRNFHTILTNIEDVKNCVGIESNNIH